jgi:broad specificity phosphatase PhoE
MRLILVRHGESQHWLTSTIAGERGCAGLTDRGREQARLLRDRLAVDLGPVDAVYSSTLPRARETAGVLGPAILGAGTEVVADCELCEMHVGAGDGLSKAENAERYGSFNPVAEPDRPLAPGGDSWLSFRTRVRTALATLADRHPHQTVVAVTHAGFIVLSLLETFAIPRPGTGARVDPDFTSLTEWEFLEDERAFRLVRFNDTAHLPVTRPAPAPR